MVVRRSVVYPWLLKLVDTRSLFTEISPVVFVRECVFSVRSVCVYNSQVPGPVTLLSPQVIQLYTCVHRQ